MQYAFADQIDDQFNAEYGLIIIRGVLLRFWASPYVFMVNFWVSVAI